MCPLPEEAEGSAGENVRSRRRTEMGGVAGCGRAPVSPAWSLPLPHPGASEHRGASGRAALTWRTQGGAGGETGLGSGQRASAARGEGVAEAGGAFQERAGHCRAVAAVLKATTAEQQGPTGVNMQTTHTICKYHRELGPGCLSLSIRVSVQSSRGGTGKASP